MLKVSDKAHFINAVQFARKCPKETRQSFKHCLKVLNRIKRNARGEIELRPDFVAHSFYFNIPGSLSGGMVLHGFENTFSVELSTKNFPHWSIHT